MWIQDGHIFSSVFFLPLFTAFLPFAMLSDFPEKLPISHCFFWYFLPARWANYPSVHLNVNLGRTLDGLFVLEKSSPKKDRRTDKLRRLNRLTETCSSPFHQIIFPSETICPSRWFVCLPVWKRLMVLIVFIIQFSKVLYLTSIISLSHFSIQ